MGFSRQGYWSGFPCPLPGDTPDLGIEPSPRCLLHWQVGSSPLVPPGRPCTHPNLVSNSTLLKLQKKEHKTDTPAWLCNFSLLTGEGGTVLEAQSYHISPLPGKVIEPLFLSLSSLCLCISIWHWCTDFGNISCTGRQLLYLWATTPNNPYAKQAYLWIPLYCSFVFKVTQHT